MTNDSFSMKTANEDVEDVASATQRRPDFCAEALSPPIRIGLLLLELFTAGLLFFIVLALGIWPDAGVLAINESFGVLTLGIWLGLTFILMLVYGALLANNPRLGKWERISWYTLFASAGPIALPAYWMLHVWPVPYEPVVGEVSTGSGHDTPPPYVREENSTYVLTRPVQGT